MAVHIRLSRGGTKKKPFYRVVVTDHRSPRGGRFLENIGTFDPLMVAKKAEAGGTAESTDVTALKLDHERLDYWRSKGALTSETLTRLLKRQVHASAGSNATPAAKK